MKKLTAFLFVSFLAAASVRADVIYQDTFNYPNGPVIITSTNSVVSTNALWVRFSGSASPSDLMVNNNQLEVSTTGSYLGVTVGRADDCGRPFSVTNNSPYTNGQQVIYVSFIVNFTNLPTANGAYCAMFKYGLPTSTSYEGKLWALAGNPNQTTNNFAALPNTFRLGVQATGTGNGAPTAICPIDLALNTPYQVVLLWDPITDYALSLWVNPISSSDARAETSDSLVPSLANIVNDFAFRQATGFGGFFTVSNLVVSTTFQEALTNVLSTNAVAPVIVYQPAAVTSNFVDSSFNLTAVANGQGLRNLTYQWQKSATPDNASPVNVDNLNGNVNVFSFLGAQTADSGYYTLIVKTPYGLSATSSIAKVAITATPVPPSFITQPASQTVYKGSTVIFSTSVSSPGNVYFTWYSNNVVISAGQVDDYNNNSSTYTLNNVQPNYSATYKVAVTNDVVANGVVSTNAVLTVNNPNHVSIAYLRTLVDPGNGFAHTNVPPTIPYEITGTVTTYTNITSGNTASYYLQDGTAGINIFATFGSTFRPHQGDVVTFVGVLSSYATGLELYADPVNRAYTSFINTGATNALPAPISIPFDVVNANNITNVNLNIAGSLVKLTDVYFGTNAGTIITNHIITITNSSGQSFNIQTFALDLDTLNQTFPAYAYSVTGVLYGINTNFTVAITRFADIVTTSSVLIPTVPAGLTSCWYDPFGRLLYVTGTNGQAGATYYLLESTNLALPLSQWKTVATNVVGAAHFTFIGTNADTPSALHEFYILSNTNSNHP